jgi:hypothetical protein
VLDVVETLRGLLPHSATTHSIPSSHKTSLTECKDITRDQQARLSWDTRIEGASSNTLTRNEGKEATTSSKLQHPRSRSRRLSMACIGSTSGALLSRQRSKSMQNVDSKEKDVQAQNDLGVVAYATPAIKVSSHPLPEGCRF